MFQFFRIVRGEVMNRSFIVRIAITRELKHMMIAATIETPASDRSRDCFRWARGDKLSDSVLPYNSLR